MDGLTISTSNGINELGQSRSSDRIQNKIDKGVGSVGQGSFGDTLKQAIENVNALQKDSDVAMQNLATGKSENLHDTLIKAEKADIALRLMVQVRNKIIDAYQEIMKMQV